MAMYVKSNYDGFVCTVQVTSDTIDEIDLTAPDFRIDIVNQFEAADNAQQIAMLLEQKATEEQKRDLRTDIMIPSGDPIYKNKKTGEWVTTEEAYNLSGAGPWTYAELSAMYDERIAALHYATEGEADVMNKQVAGISYTMDQANSAVNACENGTSGVSGHIPGIKEYIANTSNPMLSITCNGSPTYETSSASGVHGVVKIDVFANTDDETLIRNGMQYWVSKDKKSLTFRFIPQVNAEYKFQSVVVVCALDYQNIARFEVCLMPRLITGDLEKCTDKDPLKLGAPTDDPYIPSAHPRAVSSINPQTQEVEWETIEDDYRPDYVFNDDTVDNNHMFVNNTPWTTATDPNYKHKVTPSLTPLYQLKSSAYITDDIVGSGYTYNWSKFKSEIYDFGTLSSMPIPFKIGEGEGVTATGVNPTAKSATIQLVSSYNGSAADVIALNNIDVKVYEITQYIETSADVPKFSQNQVRVTVAI